MVLRLSDVRTAHAELDVLSERARRTRDPQLEARVVRQRYDLGRELLTAPVAGTGQAVSPTALDVGDPFPGLVGRPPAIDASELGVDLLRGALAYHGCVVVRGFFSRDAVTMLRDDIDRVADGFDRWMASGQRESTPSWFEPFEAPDAVLPLALRSMCGPVGTFYAADAPRAFLHMIDAFDATGLPELLLEYLDEPVLLGLEKTSIRRVPAAVPNAWHQDGLRFGRDVGLVNVWVPLCHCGQDAPTLGVLPKRLREILPVDTDSLVPWEIHPDALRRAAEGIEPVVLDLAPGDAVIFDEMLAHSTITNDGMTQRRYGADAWFFPVTRFPTELYKPLVYAVP